MGRLIQLTRQLDTAFNRPSAASLRSLRSQENSDEEIAQEQEQQQMPRQTKSHTRGMLSPQLPKREPLPQKPHPSPNPCQQISREPVHEESQRDRKLLSAQIAMRSAAPLPPAGGKHLASPMPERNPTPLPPAALHGGLHFPSIQDREAAPLPPTSSSSQPSSPTSSLAPRLPTHQALATPTTNRQPTPLPPAALHKEEGHQLSRPPSPSIQHLPTPHTGAQPTPLPRAALSNSPAKQLTLPPSPMEESIAQPPPPSHHPLPTPNNQAQPTPLPPAALHSQQAALTLPPSPTRQHLSTPTTRRQPTPLPPAALHSPATQPPPPSHHPLPTPNNQAQPTPLPPAALHSQQAALTLPPSPTHQHLATPTTHRQPTPLPPAALHSPATQPPPPSNHHLPTPNNQAQPTPLPPAALYSQQENLTLPPSPTHQHLATPTTYRQPTPLPPAALHSPATQPPPPSNHHLPTPNNQAQPTPLPPAALHSQQAALTLPPSPTRQHLATPTTRRHPTPLPPAALHSPATQPPPPSNHHLPTPNNQAQPTPLPPAALYSQQENLTLPPSPTSKPLPTPDHRDPTPLPPSALYLPPDQLVQPPPPSHHPLPTPNNQAQPTPLPPAALSSQQLTLPPSPTHKSLPTPDRGQHTPLPPAALPTSPQDLIQPPPPSHQPLPTPDTHAQPTPLPPAALSSTHARQLSLPPSPTHKHLPTPDLHAQPSPLPPSVLRSPHFARGGLSLVTRTPPLTSSSSSKQEKKEVTGGIGSSIPYLSVISVEDQKKEPKKNDSLKNMSLRAPTPVRTSQSDSESEDDDEDFKLPFKQYDPSDSQERLREQRKKDEIQAPIGRRLVNPPIMGMAPHPMYHHAPQVDDTEEQRRQRGQYVIGRVGHGLGSAGPSLLAQDNRVAIQVEGEKNSLVHFDVGQVFAWDFLRKKQRITQEDYDMALKIQRNEEERIARELQERRDQAKETELSDAEYARLLAEEKALQQSMRQSRLQEQQLQFSTLTNSLLMDLEKGGFDMGQLGIPEIDQPVGQDPQGPTMTESMVKRPLEMSTADLTQSMMTEKWRTLTDMRLAKNEEEKETIQKLLDLEIATKLQAGLPLSEIFMSMNEKNKIWGMVENLRCFHSMATQEGRNFGPIRDGNRIYLPNTILKYLDIGHQDQVHVEIVNPSLPNRQRYTAVAEFVDAVGIAIVPPALMEDLKLDEGEVAQFCRIEMPIATKVSFKSETHFEYDMKDLQIATTPYSSFEKGGKLVVRDKSGAEQVLTCSAVAPESPAALPYPGGVTTFEVEMPPAGHQIPFARVEVDGRGAEGWVEEDETIYFDFIADNSLANKRILVSLDAKFGDPDFFVCIDTEGRDRIEPQNLGPSKYHWSSSLVDNGQVAIEIGDAYRRLGVKYYIAVRGFLMSAAFIINVKTETLGERGPFPSFLGSEMVMQTLTCPYCGEGGILGEDALKAHLTVCPAALQFGASC